MMSALALEGECSSQFAALRRQAIRGGCLSNYLGHMRVNGAHFENCVAESADGGAILNHGVMQLSGAITYKNNSVHGSLSPTAGKGAGADCLCMWQDSGGVPSAEGQCDGCSPQDNKDCVKASGELKPDQPTFFCPAGKN